MSKRGKQRAWTEFRDPIVRVVNCVDQSARLIERQFEDGNRILASPSGIPFGERLTLSFSLTLMHVVKNGEDRMTTRRYTFTISDADTDARVFAWHWHPYSKKSKVLYPHVHIPSDAPYSTRHVPTGRMCLEDVVLFGFDELEVVPTVDRARTIVVDIRDRHKQHRGWH